MQVDRYRVDVYNALDLVDDLVDHGTPLDRAIQLAAERFKVKPQEILEAYDGTY
jgi:hypothetical protein